MLNVSDMPEDYWAWSDNGSLVPLGVCEDFTAAFDVADEKVPTYHWVFSRQGLEEFKEEVLRELRT